MRTSIKLYILLLMTFANINTYSQKLVNVITKTVVKEFEYSGKTVIIHGEKSNITVQRWKGKKIKIEIQLIAKNHDKSKAERDLNVMQYSFQNGDKYIKASNYFKSNGTTDITSNLSVEYSIYIPGKTNIQLINLYGDVNLNSVEISGKLKNSFGNIKINNVIGDLTVDMHYANLKCTGLSGKVTINAKNSDILLHEISGDYNLTTTYGTINIASVTGLRNLLVNAQRTSIYVTIDNFEDYNYSLSVKDDKIIVPAGYTSLIKEESGLLKFIKHSNSINNLISIHTTFCPITLKTEKNEKK